MNDDDLKRKKLREALRRKKEVRTGGGGGGGGRPADVAQQTALSLAGDDPQLMKLVTETMKDPRATAAMLKDLKTISANPELLAPPSRGVEDEDDEEEGLPPM